MSLQNTDRNNSVEISKGGPPPLFEFLTEIKTAEKKEIVISDCSAPPPTTYTYVKKSVCKKYICVKRIYVKECIPRNNKDIEKSYELENICVGLTH